MQTIAPKLLASLFAQLQVGECQGHVKQHHMGVGLRELANHLVEISLLIPIPRELFVRLADRQCHQNDPEAPVLKHRLTHLLKISHHLIDNLRLGLAQVVETTHECPESEASSFVLTQCLF